MTDALNEELFSAKFVSVAFHFWAVDYYSRAYGASPELGNMDDELIEPVTLHFPVLSSTKEVVLVLDFVATPEREGDENLWRWLPKPNGEIADDERVSILGFVRLDKERLELETNSQARQRETDLV